MIDILFMILISAYLWFSIKIENWMTITYLGFPEETPLLYLKHSRIYTFIRALIFVLSIILSFFMTFIPWILCFLIVALFWVLSGKIGRDKAFNTYREIFTEAAITEENSDKKNDFIKESKKSNHEIQDIATRRMG